MVIVLKVGEMRAWTVLLCMAPVMFLAKGKRFDSSMVDPLARRSTLDKNFMRFGRSSPSFTQKPQDDVLVEVDGALSSAETNKEDNFLRSMRGKDNFIRFGRNRDANLMRFGRVDGSFFRLGRGNEKNFMRFGRGKEDNLMRFGRGKENNYMRFGREKPFNYLRFSTSLPLPQYVPPNQLVQDNMHEQDTTREVRGKEGNFMRFGKNDAIPGTLRAGTMVLNMLEKDRAESEDTKYYPRPSGDAFERESKSKDSNLLRFGRQPPNKDDSFIRFGRSDSVFNPDLIPPRLKRSLSHIYESRYDFLPDKLKNDLYDKILAPYSSVTQDLNEKCSPEVPKEDTDKEKRSANDVLPSPDPLEEERVVDHTSAKLVFNNPDLPISLLSAGLPNVIVGPEFALLPDLVPPENVLKGGQPGDNSFLRLG